MIIPSKEVLLITAAQKKQLYLFDPKTACVLHTYSTESTLAPTAAYFQQGQQFMIPHLNNTYINIWDADAQQPKKFSVGQGQKATCLQIVEDNILYMGSSHGIFYIFQLPSGILIRKVQLHSHSSEIARIIFMKQLGYIITGTKKQIKLWALKDLITPQQKPVSEKTIHSVLQIAKIELVRGILCVVTEKSIQFYFANNLSLFSIGRDLPQLSNILCSCASNGSIFVGDAQGKIKQVPIDAHEKELQFENRKGKVSLQIKKGIQIETKDPISALSYVNSLEYLISGNYKGEIKIWHGKTLKNSVQLFKTSIQLIFTLPRPNKDIKIPQNLKIKSFHKQQLTKIDQPIYYDSKDTLQMYNDPQTQISSDTYLERMLNYLNDPSEQLENEIQAIRRENKQLLEANLHCFTLLEQDNGRTEYKKQYK